MRAGGKAIDFPVPIVDGLGIVGDEGGPANAGPEAASAATADSPAMPDAKRIIKSLELQYRAHLVHFGGFAGRVGFDRA